MIILNKIIFAGQFALLPNTRNNRTCDGCGAYKGSACLLSAFYYRNKMTGVIDAIYPCNGGSKNIPNEERKEMKGIRIDGQK